MNANNMEIFRGIVIFFCANIGYYKRKTAVDGSKICSMHNEAGQGKSL